MMSYLAFTTAAIVFFRVCYQNMGVIFAGQYPGVISRGAQEGGAPLVKILDHFGGAQPPPRNFCIGLAFQSLLTLLPKYFLLLCSIVHCYVVIETFLLLIILYQYYIRLLYLSFKNMGVAAARPHPKCGRGCT